MKWFRRGIPQEVRRQYFEAVEDGEIPVVEKLRKKYAAIRNDPEIIQGTLERAAAEGQLLICELALKWGADVDHHDPSARQFGAIEEAVDSGNLDLVKFLYSKGASLRTDTIDENPLFTAIYNGHKEIVEWLVQTDLDQHRIYDVGEGCLKNAYSFAIQQGQEEIKQVLREASCVPPGRNSSDTADINERGYQSSDGIIAHFREFFGPAEPLALQEVFPVSAEGPSVSVHCIRTERGLVLFTAGMSDRPLNVPEGKEEYQYAELMMQLPRDFQIPTDLKKAADGTLWPFRWLRDLAYMPHEERDWLRGDYTVISSADPPIQLGPNTTQSCFLLVTSADLLTNVVLPEKSCKVYRVLPIYTEERDLMLERGVEVLWRRLSENDVGYTVDLDRINVAIPRGE